VISIPLEKADAEWLARVREQTEFLWLKQIWPSKNGNPHWPYNSKGIRSIGGALKSNPKKIEDQSIRFSRKTKYKWSEAKIRRWIKEHGFDLKGLTKLKAGKIFDYYTKKKYMNFRYTTPDFRIITKAHEEGKPLIIEGVINSSSIDAYGEIVSPDAVMKSLEFYEKYPTVRWMHGPIPIGKTLDIWKDGDFVKARIEIDADEEKIISKILKGTVRAFSIGFMALSWDRFCPKKGKCVRRFTEILLIEISPVDSPANRDAQMTDVSWKTPLNTEEYWSFDNDSEDEEKLESLDLSELDFHTTHLCDEPDGDDFDAKGIELRFSGSPKNPYGAHNSFEFKGGNDGYKKAWKLHFSQINGGSLTPAASGPIRGTVRRIAMIAAGMKPPCKVVEAEGIGARSGSKSPLPGDFPEKPSDYGLSQWKKPSEAPEGKAEVANRFTCSDLNVIKRIAVMEIKRRIKDREKKDGKGINEDEEEFFVWLLGLESIESKRGIKMPKDEKKKEEEDELDEEEEEKKKKEEEESPQKSTEEETSSGEEETNPEPDGTEKILKAIEALSEKVELNSKELERMKMSEEEKKTAEEIETKVQEQIKSYKDATAELEKKNAELETEIKIKKAVEQAVEEERNNAPPVRASMSVTEQTQNPFDSESKNDEEAYKVLSKYAFN
jgi:hypothetical protein